MFVRMLYVRELYHRHTRLRATLNTVNYVTLDARGMLLNLTRPILAAFYGDRPPLLPFFFFSLPLSL